MNETPTEKLIRELKEENTRLMELLKSGGGGGPIVEAAVAAGSDPGGSDAAAAEMSDEELEELKAQMEENKKEMDEMKRTWEEKLKAAQDALQEKDMAEERRKQKCLSTPHLYNLNVDPQLTGKVVYMIEKGNVRSFGDFECSLLVRAGQHTIGNKCPNSTPDILLIGPK